MDLHHPKKNENERMVSIRANASVLCGGVLREGGVCVCVCEYVK